jgi:hypothetical protein
VQLNARSAKDQDVLTKFNTSLNIPISGNSSENLHPRLAISRFLSRSMPSRDFGDLKERTPRKRGGSAALPGDEAGQRGPAHC